MALKPQYPFHCLRYVGGKASNVIIASAGTNLYTYSAEDGRKLYTWPQVASSGDVDVENNSVERGDGPPEKRRKLSPSSTGKDEKKGTHKNSEPTTQPPAWSSIPILVISSSGRYVIAVTAEDKHVRVFELGSDGTLTQLSARPVPKRLCAVCLSFDDSTIFCADKGGEVYAIPLLLPGNGEIRITSRPKKQNPPAANPLVVHTKRNLQSLRQQLRQQGQEVDSKADPAVERDVLLGHVSMLTDLAIASLPSNSSTHSLQFYMFTADRDEQIRVSRGPPQTHVIEAYCLGHESFISKLCIPASLPHILISGGGDDYLLVWDWRAGQVLRQVPIAPGRKEGKTVVRGIYAIPIENSSSVAILVTLDGSHELLSFLLHQDGQITPPTFFQTSGNVLDAAWSEDRATLFLSIDACHEPGSIATWKSDFNGTQTLVESYTIKLEDGSLGLVPVASQIIENINTQGTEDIYAELDEPSKLKAQKSLSGTLYNLHNLRKRIKNEDV